jgi:Sec-independent protein translocase protein TatA
MLASPTNLSMLAQIYGPWETFRILAVTVILFAAGRLPNLTRGLRKGFSRFLSAVGDESHDAGKSLGGIFGKPAAQALTPDNRTAELYDPAAFHKQETAGHAARRTRFRHWGRLWRLMWRAVFNKIG